MSTDQPDKPPMRQVRLQLPPYADAWLEDQVKAKVTAWQEEGLNIPNNPEARARTLIVEKLVKEAANRA